MVQLYSFWEREPVVAGGGDDWATGNMPDGTGARGEPNGEEMAS